MKICIVKDENGLSVGIEPPEAHETMEDMDYLQPVADEREVFMRVRELLNSNPEKEAQDNADFEGGFSEVDSLNSRGLE